MKFKFNGTVLGIFGIQLLCMFIVFFSLGVATPWAVVIGANYFVGKIEIGGKRLVFKGTGGGLFIKFIIWYVLTYITLGIYSFWLIRNMTSWFVENTEFEENLVFVNQDYNLN